jgi:hypothetical protein
MAEAPMGIPGAEIPAPKCPSMQLQLPLNFLRFLRVLRILHSPLELRTNG